MIMELGLDICILLGVILWTAISTINKVAKTPHVPNSKPEVLLLPLPKHRDPSKKEYNERYQPQ